MKREELFLMHEHMTMKAFELLKAKNQDYAKRDGLDNLTLCESMGVCSAEHGVVIRLTDKLSRLATVLANGEAQVKDESIEDTCLDLINYAVLLRALSLREKK